MQIESCKPRRFYAQSGLPLQMICLILMPRGYAHTRIQNEKNWGGNGLDKNPINKAKSTFMRDSDALITFVGEIIHGDPDSGGILLTKQHCKGPVQEKDR
jgi:hypothetical protein